MQPGDTISPDASSSSDSPKHSDARGGKRKQEEQLYSEDSFVTDASSQKSSASSKDTVRWEASEYVDHEKANGWYGILAFGAVVVMVLVYLLSKDIFATVMIAIAVILFGVVAARKPRTLSYLVDQKGIKIADKLYTYENFKTFSVIQDGAIHSIQLLPLKRFMPPLVLYYPPDQEQDVVETLGRYIPYQDKAQDTFDRLMARIRF